MKNIINKIVCKTKELNEKFDIFFYCGMIAKTFLLSFSIYSAIIYLLVISIIGLAGKRTKSEKLFIEENTREMQ